MTLKICLVYIVLMHFDLMVTRTQIYLEEERFPMELIHQLINPWNRIYIFLGSSCWELYIQCTCARFHLIHKDHWRWKWDWSWSNVSQVKKLFNGFLYLIIEPFGVLVKINLDGLGSHIQLNSMHNSPFKWSSLWKILKHPFMLAQNILDVLMMVRNINGCSLGSNNTFNIPLNVSMPHGISHAMCYLPK